MFRCCTEMPFWKMARAPLCIRLAGSEPGKPAEGSLRADNEAARASKLYQLLMTTQACPLNSTALAPCSVRFGATKRSWHGLKGPLHFVSWSDPYKLHRLCVQGTPEPVPAEASPVRARRLFGRGDAGRVSAGSPNSRGPQGPAGDAARAAAMAALHQQACLIPSWALLGRTCCACIVTISV